MKPYRDNVSFHDILRDGWSRGFHVSQTVDEAAAMGYNTTEEAVKDQWREYDAEMEAYFANDPYHEHDDCWAED